VEPYVTGLSKVTSPWTPSTARTLALAPLTSTATLVGSVVTTPPLLPSTMGTCLTLKTVLLFGPAPPEKCVATMVLSGKAVGGEVVTGAGTVAVR